jgi:single-strand DNA-binding protein
MINRIVLVGRLTNDPEERFSNDGMEISKFRIAVDRRGRGRGGERGDREAQDADFFNVVAFRNSAKFVNQYMRRGNLVAVEGSLHIDEYTDREGVRQRWIEVVADNVQSLQSRAESEAMAGGGGMDDGERRGGRGGGGGGGGRQWDHDKDFEDGFDEPAGGRGRGQAPAESAGERPSRSRTFNPPNEDPFASEDRPARGGQGGGQGGAAKGGAAKGGAAGGSFDDDYDDPFSEE